MATTNGKIWERCVAEWRFLMQQIRDGIYELPIACLVSDGVSVPLLIRDVRIVGGEGDDIADALIEVIEEGKEHSPPFLITRDHPATFKAGKDRNGAGKTVFLTKLE